MDIKRDLVGVSTCEWMHEHGAAKMRFSYQLDNPLVFDVSTNISKRDDAGNIVHVRKVHYELYRETMHLWLLHAPAGGVVEFGEISVKVRRTMPYIITFKFPTLVLDDEYEATPMFMVSREYVQRFIADTYVALPAELEYAYLNVDDCITKILTGGSK